ncbi:MAG: hypothetical protein ISS33_02255 [Candidatus Omnitrophica bacterium]|nr:hypothetical protein [Candidatus Omnitrophota bacterium]
MEKYFGDLAWWPAETDFEVIVGTVLTQGTSWRAASKAIENLKAKNILTAEKILSTKDSSLSRVIRSSGYHRVKAKRLKAISRFIVDECASRLGVLKKQKTENLRKKLLKTYGIGPETADSILVYALGKPVFVVDAYTKRIFSRHNLIGKDASYSEIQQLVYKKFPIETKKLNQFHAVLVETAKKFCKKTSPLCSECPLGDIVR